MQDQALCFGRANVLLYVCPDTMVEMASAYNGTKGGWGRVTNAAQNPHHVSSALSKPHKIHCIVFPGACHKAE